VGKCPWAVFSGGRASLSLESHGERARSETMRAAIPAPGSPIQFAEFIKKEIDTWGEVVRATGTKPGN
jgi:tripartite-type tricarboxylate transporter receptor subunit TctC